MSCCPASSTSSPQSAVALWPRGSHPDCGTAPRQGSCARQGVPRRDLQTRTRDEWEEWFKGRDVCFAPVLDLAEAFQRPHVAAREMLIRDADGNLHIGDPIKFRHEPPRIDTRVPALGEHTGCSAQGIGGAPRGSEMNDTTATSQNGRVSRAALSSCSSGRSDAADRKRAALHVLDWIGCAVAGATTPPGVAMIAYGRTMPTGGCRTVGGTVTHGARRRTGQRFVRQRAGDGRSLPHGAGPYRAGGRAGRAGGGGGDRAHGPALLDAVIRGFEAMIRVGRSVGPTHYKLLSQHGDMRRIRQRRGCRVAARPRR